MPPMASNSVGGLRVLFALRRNAYQAFPSRCLDEPVVTLRALGRSLVLATAPDAIRHIMITQGEDYVRLPVGRRVLGPIVGEGLRGTQAERWAAKPTPISEAYTEVTASPFALAGCT